MWLIYWMGSIDSIKACIAGVCGAFGGSGCGILLISYIGHIICVSGNDDDGIKKIKILRKPALLLSFLLIPAIMTVFIPSSRTLALMYGVNRVENFVNNNKDNIDEISNKTLKIINKKLDDLLEGDKK